MFIKALTFLFFISIILIGCTGHQTRNQSNQSTNQLNQKPQQEMKTTRLHIDSFMKSKSGAIWMAWTEKVKQALDGLAYVRKVEMVLERDEFLVAYDSAKGNDELLIEIVKQSGYRARVVSNQAAKPEQQEKIVLPEGFNVLDKALAQAKRENKPLVIDFYAEWCIPYIKSYYRTLTIWL